jgi:kumamolisin
MPPQQSFVGVVVPADLPSVTGVGGTSLSTTANGNYVGETTWSEPLLSQGTGGGVSQVFAQPSWQTGSGTGQYDPTKTRQVPDVSADADPASGATVVIDGQQQTGGGTSQAAPLWAGFTALLDQYLQQHGGHRVGFFNQTLYELADGSPQYKPFHDVIVGGNDLYPATSGYDMASGLGSPDVWNLARDLAAEKD